MLSPQPPPPRGLGNEAPVVKNPIPFGKYYLLERINVGGMAEVFRAKAYGVEGFERLVAVKRILPNIAEDKEFIRMFIDEAKIAVQLNHANIAQIFDLGVVENHYYIAMEHIHGRDLRAIFDRCRQHGEPMPISQACFVTMKVCEGLDYAHNKRDQAGRELNLVHRDVSPQNVLVSFEGEVKLIDFGIAKAAGKGQKTQAGILKGKFSYMSPEQVRGLPIDRRSDVFSCGIVLYELLTGERLFIGESDFSTLEKVRNVEILPPSTYNRRIPDELERIVLKALSKDVEDRYQNAIDLHDELQAFVYTAGEFYSRKDLAAWMKGTFTKEIEQETAKLESYRQIPPPEGRPSPPKRPLPSGTGPQRKTTLGMSTAPPPVPGKNGQAALEAKQARAEDLEWDEDELETSIYADEKDKAPLGPAASLAAQSASSAGENTDLSSLVATAKGWPAPEPPSNMMPASQALADGSSQAALTDDAPTVDETGMKAEEPSAVLRLATLGQQQAAAQAAAPAAPVFDPSMATGMSYGRRRMSNSTIIKIAAASVVAIGVLVLVLIVMSGSGSDGDKTSEDGQTLAGTQGSGEDPSNVPAAAGAAADQAVATEPAAGQAASPDTGFDLIVDPAGVQVKLDGRPIGKAPLQIRRLVEGEHLVEIEAPVGFFNKSQTVQVVGGKAERVVMKLDAMDITAKFTSSPPGARVTLTADGERQALGTTPVEAKLDPRRTYEVTFRKDGYVSENRPIQITSAGEIPIAVSLSRAVASIPKKPDPVPPRNPRGSDEPIEPRDPPDKPDKSDTPPKGDKSAEMGTLSLGSKPPCRIFIDGRDIGQKTPKVGIKLKPGRHRITLVNNEFNIKESFVIRVKPGEKLKETRDLTDRINK